MNGSLRRLTTEDVDDDESEGLVEKKGLESEVVGGANAIEGSVED